MNDTQEGSLGPSKTVPVRSEYGDLSQSIIRITEDRLKLILSEHVKNMEQRTSWITPFSLVVTIGVVFVTSKFQDFIFSAASWTAFFMLVFVLVLLWTAVAVWRAFRAKTIADLVKTIKGE